MFNVYFFNFLEEWRNPANAWGSGHVLFFFDSYIGKEMSHAWLRGWYHLLMQIMCVDGGRMKQNAIGWATFLPVLECWLCRPQLSASPSMSCSVTNSAEKQCVFTCVCVCVYTKTSLAHHKMSNYYMVLIASMEETVWMPNQTARHKLQ